jgi:hypothetical protein
VPVGKFFATARATGRCRGGQYPHPGSPRAFRRRG